MTAPDGKLKIFISWSMPLSHKVALILRDWLPRVIQDVEPWVSSEDIEKGTYWTEEIVHSLDAAKVGIIVVTPENHQRTWLNFEAGALARSIKASGGRVMPLLIDMGAADIQGPMTTLQITSFIKEDVSKLLGAINGLARTPLTNDVLDDQIELLWPRLESAVRALVAKHGAPKAPSLTDRDILEELLTGIRELRRTTPAPSPDVDEAERGWLEKLQRVKAAAVRNGINPDEIFLVRAGRSRNFTVEIPDDCDPSALRKTMMELKADGADDMFFVGRTNDSFRSTDI